MLVDHGLIFQMAWRATTAPVVSSGGLSYFKTGEVYGGDWI